MLLVVDLTKPSRKTLALGGLILVLVLVAYLARGSGDPAPSLRNVYAQSLTDYWTEIAAHAGVAPENALLHDWEVVYDEQGDVKRAQLGFLTGQGTGKVVWYTIYQDHEGRTHTSRTYPSTPVKDVVRGAVFFRELDQVGLRALEAKSGVSGTVRLTLHTIYTTGTTYSGLAHVIQDGQIISTADQPATMTGGQGDLLILPEQYSGSVLGYMYIIPNSTVP